MNLDKNTNDRRTVKAGWVIISAGDNGFDILQFTINAKDMSESSQISDDISSMIMKYGRPDDVFNTQISLRDWRVEILLALPTSTWGTIAQQEFATSISEIYS